MKIVDPSVELWAITSPINSQESSNTISVLNLLERCGRTCYKSEDKITEDSATSFVSMILKRGHESVLEHISVSFKVVCDRGVSHEIVRHRLASYSQESTRYCNYNKDKYNYQISVTPMLDGLTETQIARRKELYDYIESVYNLEIEEGVLPQQARDNLPTCLKTELIWTANLREWRHILKLRTSKAAHPQMRKIANNIATQLADLIPQLFKEYTPEGR